MKMMNAKLRRLVVMLLIAIVFLTFTDVNMKIAFSSDSGGELDLFTQKDPYSGKGFNVSSDAFAPQEEIQVFALVTYNEYPVRNLPISFVMSGPKNAIENKTFFMTRSTNDTGIAAISFRIQDPNETTFGEWVVIGTAKLANLTLHDSVKFKVGWIVEMLSIKTINESYAEQVRFTRESFVGVELTLKNIAMTDKTATLTITICDSLDTLLNSTELHDFTIIANETLVSAYSFLFIPRNASLGYATVYAGALVTSEEDLNVPYCPEVSEQFLIVNRDVAILDVQSFPTSVYRGEIVYIDVTVKNKGSESESFDVSVYHNETLIETKAVLDLLPSSNRALSFQWNTSSAIEGLHMISASIAPVPGEIDLSDNDFVDGFIEIKAKPLVIHDIAVLSVTLSSDSVYIGEILNVNVTVRNKGTFVESFHVTVYYNSYVAEVSFVDSLMPNCVKTLDFHWYTGGAAPGNYTLTVIAGPVPGERNIKDNVFVDGVVWIKPPIFPVVTETPRWLPALLFLLIMFILICLVTGILAVLLWRRKRKREDQMSRQPTSSGVTPYIGVGAKRSKTCGVCGKEFSRAYTFCPYCFTFYGRDYE